MKILSLYNLKGGVGKTTSAVNLAFAASLDGFNVLLCDLDPQGAASFYLQAAPPSSMKTGKLLKGKTFAHKQICHTEFIHLDILPGHLEFRNLDLRLDDEKKSETALRSLFKGFQGDYDLIIADAPAGITLLSENLFQLSDRVLVPTIPSTLSLNAFEHVQDFFKAKKISGKKLRGFFSMADARKKLHRETIEEHLADSNGPFMGPVIPSASIVEQMGEHRRPLAAYARKSPAAQAFGDLWQGVRSELKLD